VLNSLQHGSVLPLVVMGQYYHWLSWVSITTGCHVSILPLVVMCQYYHWLSKVDAQTAFSQKIFECDTS